MSVYNMKHNSLTHPTNMTSTNRKSLITSHEMLPMPSASYIRSPSSILHSELLCGAFLSVFSVLYSLTIICIIAKNLFLKNCACFWTWSKWQQSVRILLYLAFSIQRYALKIRPRWRTWSVYCSDVQTPAMHSSFISSLIFVYLVYLTVTFVCLFLLSPTRLPQTFLGMSRDKSLGKAGLGSVPPFQDDAQLFCKVAVPLGTPTSGISESPVF